RADHGLIGAREIEDGAEIVLDGGGRFHAPEDTPGPPARASPCYSSPSGFGGGHDGLRTHRATGADPQGSGGALAEFLSRLLAGERPEARVSGRVRQGLRRGGLARADDPRSLWGARVGRD